MVNLIDMMKDTGDGQLIEHAPSELRKDFTVAINAVSLDGWAYLYLSKELQQNYVICEIAIQQNGHLIKFTELCDQHLINTAIKSKPCLKNSNYILNNKKFLHMNTHEI